jgi:hypothetical protein
MNSSALVKLTTKSLVHTCKANYHSWHRQEAFSAGFSAAKPQLATMSLLLRVPRHVTRQALQLS